VFPLGGGGLLMGITDYLSQHTAGLALHACEPYNYPTYARYDHARSKTIADGLMLDEPHAKVHQRIAELNIPVHLVGEAEIRAAMRDLYQQQGLLVEPSSAITTALVASDIASLEEPVCVVLTGANIADNDFYRLIS
jgi:threonine dehydratase